MDAPTRIAHLRDYGAIVWRRRWEAVAVLLAVVLFAVFRAFVSTPLYRATAVIQIERNNPDVLTFDELSRPDSAFPAYVEFYQTQFRILASEPVARLAAQRVGLPSHPMIESTGRPGLMARLRGLLPRVGIHRKLDPLERATALVVANVEVTPLTNTHLVNVSWTATDPELAAKVANAIVDAYVELSVRSEFSTSEEATGFLLDQISDLRAEIAKDEADLQHYGESKRIVSFGDATNVTFQALTDVAKRRTEAEAELAARRAAYDAARSAPPEALAEVLSSPVVSDLRSQYAQLAAEYSKRSERFKDEWPEMKAIRSQMDDLSRQIATQSRAIADGVVEAAAKAYREAQNEVRNLTRLLDEREAAAQSLKRDAVEFENLRAVVQKKRETLDALIARQSEIQLSSRLGRTEIAAKNVRILGRATPPSAPYSPRPMLSLVLGVALGLGAGLCAALVIDYFDNNVQNPEDIERLGGPPLLATVPKLQLGRRAWRRGSPSAIETVETVCVRSPQSPIAEAYRDLRTAILLSATNRPARSILVSSTLPEEGKSATSVNLAIVLAQLGRKVALVDTDLRRPRLHRILATPNDRGLSTMLAGLGGVGLEDVVLPTAVPGLSLVPSGPVPPNPAELLNVPRLAELPASLAAAGYDHVVLDSSPAGPTADPLIVARHVDVVVLVVRADRVPRPALKRVIEKLANAGTRPLGIVLNGADSEVASRYGYQTYGYASREDAGRGTGTET